MFLHKMIYRISYRYPSLRASWKSWTATAMPLVTLSHSTRPSLGKCPQCQAGISLALFFGSSMVPHSPPAYSSYWKGAVGTMEQGKVQGYCVHTAIWATRMCRQPPAHSFSTSFQRLPFCFYKGRIMLKRLWWQGPSESYKHQGGNFSTNGWKMSII